MSDESALSGIIEVAEIFNSKDTNSYLNAGWVLLNTTPTEQGVLYVLGWPRDAGNPPQHPKSNYGKGAT